MAEVTTVAPSRAFASSWSGFARRIGQAAFAAAGLILAAVPGEAQEGTPVIVNPGNAVVTGFSGTAPGQAPEGADPADYLTIDLNGPAARVVDLSTLGPQGQLTTAAKPFTVSAAQVGQVFGAALDSAAQPNVYLAATSAYGVSIYVPDQSGVIRRVRNGAAGAQFVPGQFGPPDQGGGPGSIWRIDGVTGEVTLFSTIDSAAQGVAALGGLVFDPRTQQLFVSDRISGLIHRLTLDGVDRGTFDHGKDGRQAAGLTPLPDGQLPAVDITNPAFDTTNPSTWGYAPPSRRIFGLGVWQDRLYYAVAEGPQVWSVGIGQDGAFAGDARLEVEVPALQDGVEIASITFDGLGTMYLAERGAVTGDYQLTNLASEGVSRVLRFLPKAQGDTNPGQWRLQPDQYAIGLPQGYNNGNGGVALGYGYQESGAIDIGQCRATVWSTGERLLDPGDPNAAPGSFPAVDGLQGNSPDLVEPQNEPPSYSWFIDYNDQTGNPLFRGYVGAIQILSPCSEQGAYVPPPPPPPPPPVLRCPPGTALEGGQCVVTVSCPSGTVYRNGYCVYPSCPPGYVRYRNQCVQPPQACPQGTVFHDGRCVPLGCPPGMVQLSSGYCACPPGVYYFNGRCVPPTSCPPGMVTSPGGICWCPPNSYFVGGQCVSNYCPPGYQRRGGQCVPRFCQPGYEFGPDGFCHPRFNRCPPDQMPYFNYCVPRFCPPATFRGNDGYCYPYGNTCGPGQEYFGGSCVAVCLPLFKRDPTGICISIVEFDRKLNLCQGGKVKMGNACVCPPDKQDGPNGNCIPKAAPKPVGLPPCPGGMVRPGAGACVCPTDKPDFSTGVCSPRQKGPGLPPCPNGQMRVGAGQCTCPPDKPDFSTGTCAPRRKPAGLPPCPGVQIRSGGTGRCTCPPDRPDFSTGVCRPKPPTLPPCPGIQIRPGGTGACTCPPDKPDFSTGSCQPKPAALPACPDGQVRPGGTGACTCPPDKPDFSTGACRPKPPTLPPCPGIQIRPGGTGACTCPPDKPDFSTGSCRSKPAALPACPDGQVRPGGTGACTCPPDKPDFSSGTCRPKPAAPAKPAGLPACPGIQIRPGGSGPCTCPPDKPDFSTGVCKPKSAAGGQAGADQGQKPPACKGGKLDNGKCECPPGTQLKAGACDK